MGYLNTIINRGDELRELSNMIDDWTIAHGFAGFFMACFNISPGLMLLLAFGWEIIEEPVKGRTEIFGKEPMIETSENQLIDIGAVVAGYGAYHLVSEKPAGMMV